VDFDLSADQEALREAAGALLDKLADRQVLRRRVGPGTVVGTLPGAGTGGGAGVQAPSGFDATLWSAMADQGWLAVERAEEDGGLGLSMVEVAVLCEQLGRHVAPAPFLGTVLVHDAVVRGATRAGDRERTVLLDLAERLASGAAVGAVAFSGDPEAVHAEVEGDEVVLTGRPDPVLYGASAQVVVLGAGDALYALRLPEGHGAVPEPAMDRTRELAWLDLDHHPALRLGGAEEGQRVLDRAATGVAAELLGASQQALDMAVEYAKQRVQFGKPIGSFQAVKHKLADALVDVEGMRSTVYYAAWCVAAEDPEVSLAASMAKAWCADASRRVMATCLQVHGGIGFTWEHDLHLFVKRAQLDQVSFGDAAWHRDRLAGMLRRRLADRQSLL
jgi:alkylation response protein AidB-like acyl-CoA dehydrogenase